MSFRVSLGCHAGFHSKFPRVSFMVSLGLIYCFLGFISSFRGSQTASIG